MTDELRNNLNRLDPMHAGVETESPTTLSSRLRMERVMSTTLNQSAVKQPKRTWIVATGLAVAALAVTGVLANLNSTNDPAPVAAVPLEFNLGTNDSLASCIQFDVAILRDMKVAFEGTATAVDGDNVTLAVDHWYKGGEGDEVSLIGTAGMEALIGGIPFEVGNAYLITANDGQVNYCGYSGEATPEYRAAFDEAFGS